jgi:hypothetical protein
VILRIEELLKKTDRGELLDPRLRSALVKCQTALRNDPAGTATAGAYDLSRAEELATGDETRTVVRNAIRLEYARRLRAALGASRN